MVLKLKIGILGGTGWLGGALARNQLKAGHPPGDLLELTTGVGEPHAPSGPHEQLDGIFLL